MEINEKNMVGLIRDLDQIKKHRSYPTGFNLFESTGMVRQEIRHSNFLGFLLDPKKPHGLGTQFIKEIILRAAIANEDREVAQLSTLLGDFDDLIVKREWSTAGSKKKIDIVAWSPTNRSVFVIENKVDSGAGKNQLADYVSLIGKHEIFNEYQKTFLFLTKSSDEPEEELWLQLGYEDIVDILLEMIRENENTLGLELRTAIEHYVDLLRRYIVGDENLKAECSRIIDQYGDVLTFIYKHAEQSGQGSDFKSASLKFYEEYKTKINDIVTKPTQYAFIPKSLDGVVAECKGTNFWGQQKPILMWFYLRGDNSLGLILEVGPIPDATEERRGLVESLQKIIGRNRIIKDTYSRVWSKYVRLEEDPDESMILSQMTKLWSEFESKFESDVARVVEEFFRKKT